MINFISNMPDGLKAVILTIIILFFAFGLPLIIIGPHDFFYVPTTSERVTAKISRQEGVYGEQYYAFGDLGDTCHLSMKKFVDVQIGQELTCDWYQN